MGQKKVYQGTLKFSFIMNQAFLYWMEDDCKPWCQNSRHHFELL